MDGIPQDNSIAAGHDPVLKTETRGRFLNRLAAYIEYQTVWILGLIFGISPVVRYLRNPNPRTSVRLLRAFGAKVGTATTIKGSLFLDNVTGDQDATGDFSHLSIGSNCYIGDAVFFDLASEIAIENDAVVAGRAAFLTHSECGRSSYLNMLFPRRCDGVTVGSGAWIGFGATVLSGVKIGPQTTVGANSLLIHNAEDHSVYAGSPARKIRSLK